MRTCLRKWTAVAAAVILFTAALIPAVFANAPGDVDGDTLITAADARLALRIAVGLETYGQETQSYRAAEVTGDGDVRADDARLILRVSVGLESFSGGGADFEDRRFTLCFPAALSGECNVRERGDEYAVCDRYGEEIFYLYLRDPGDDIIDNSFMLGSIDNGWDPYVVFAAFPTDLRCSEEHLGYYQGLAAYADSLEDILGMIGSSAYYRFTPFYEDPGGWIGKTVGELTEVFGTELTMDASGWLRYRDTLGRDVLPLVFESDHGGGFDEDTQIVSVYVSTADLGFPILPGVNTHDFFPSIDASLEAKGIPKAYSVSAARTVLQAIYNERSYSFYWKNSAGMHSYADYIHIEPLGSEWNV